jgi:hypothetical protein
VKVFWLNRKETVKRLQEAVKTLRARHPEIERAVLFGSLQRGDAVPGSDADMLLVLRTTDLPFPDRAVVYRPEGTGIPVDVFVYTRAELDDMLAAGNHFVIRASSSARWRTAWTCREPYPRPMNGIFVAITVMNWTFASSGSPAM